MTTQSRFSVAARLLFGGIALSAAVLTSYNVQAASAQPPVPQGVPMKSWQDNGHNGLYVLQPFKGQLAKGEKRVVGTVVSDADCDIDAEGLSHCHNDIQLPGGRTITVINTHNMHVNRCLGGGDRIELSRLGNTWIVGNLLTK